MRALAVALGLLVVGGLIYWSLGTDCIAPPAKLREVRSDQTAPAQVTQAHAASRTSALAATGSLAVKRLADGTCDLSVEVVDAFGGAVRGALVLWCTRRFDQPFARMRSDAAGRCSVRVTPGSLHVRAEHPDVGRSILLRLSTEDEHPRIPRLALLRAVEVVGVVHNAAGQPIANAEVLVQGLLGIPRGYAAECVTSELLQCDENGVFSFEASYGTRGTVLLAGDEEDAKSRIAYAAGMDEWLIVGPAGVGRAERQKQPKPGSGDQPAATEIIPPWTGTFGARLENGRKPKKLQIGVRVQTRRASAVDWHRPVDGASVTLKPELAAQTSGRAWWFVRDPDSGCSACISQRGVPPRELRLIRPGEVSVSVAHAGRPARGITVFVEPCGSTQQARLRSTGRIRFRVPVGPANVRIVRGVEVLAEREVVVESAQAVEVALSVDLSR